VVTTPLVHPRVTPTDAVRALYRDRGLPELNLRSLKTLLGLDVVTKETVRHLAVYNVIRGLMEQAAREYGRPLHRCRVQSPLLLRTATGAQGRRLAPNSAAGLPWTACPIAPTPSNLDSGSAATEETWPATATPRGVPPARKPPCPLRTWRSILAPSLPALVTRTYGWLLSSWSVQPSGISISNTAGSTLFHSIRENSVVSPPDSNRIRTGRFDPAFM
jgi:hypothetical protein